MRVKFSKTFNYRPTGERRVSIRYLEGSEHTVKREAGEAAVAAGYAKEVKVKGKSEPHPDDEPEVAQVHDGGVTEDTLHGGKIA
jgi:hypothetical protein